MPNSDAYPNDIPNQKISTYQIDESEYSDVSQMQSHGNSMSKVGVMGGDRAIPSIAIHAFCHRAETAALIKASASDRRLAKGSIAIFKGGLAAAKSYYADKTTPNLLIVESLDPGQKLLADIDILAEHCDPSIKVLVLGANNDIALYRELVSRGVSEYLVPPLQPINLIRSITSIYADEEKPFMGRSIAVLGAKGGVGASTLAHNIAWAMAENVGVNTTLVDLDLNFGSTSLDFNNESPQTVADALMAPDRFDDIILDRMLLRASRNLTLFTAPATLNQTFDIESEAYETILNQVRMNVPFSVLDLPHIWNASYKNIVINADEILIVCTPDLASLRNGRNLIDLLTAARPNDVRPQLALNMIEMPKRPEIPIKEFANAIGLAPRLIMPFDPQIFGIASNNGQMISQYMPNSKIAVAINTYAAGLVGKDVIEEKPSLISRLMNFRGA